MEDRQIIELYFQRNEKAITETSLKYGAYCFAVANNILCNDEDARECVNDTWLKTWNAIPPQKPDRLRLFLARITRNLSFDKYKEKVRDKRGGGEIELALHELECCLPASSNVEAEFRKKELEDSINRFLYSLSHRDCNVFLRRYFYVETTSAIAKRYKIKESNVLLILSRTRKKLKLYLQTEGYIL